MWRNMRRAQTIDLRAVRFTFLDFATISSSSLATASDVPLIENAVDMIFYGRQGDAQAACYELVRQAVRKQLHDFPLTRGQGVNASASRPIV